jgi:murein DD-endopeptidase MepM/ murein hydrolase activator NlpD
MKQFTFLLLLLFSFFNTQIWSKNVKKIEKGKTSKKIEKGKSKTNAKTKSKSKKRTRYSYEDPLKYQRKTEIPTTYEELNFRGKGFAISIRAKEFAQGNLAFLKIASNDPECKIDPDKYKIYWKNLEIKLFPSSKGFLGLLPIHPEHRVGTNELVVKKLTSNGEILEKFAINIRDTQFPISKTYGPLKISKKFVPKEYPPETQEFIKRCEDKKRTVFENDSEIQISGQFHSPVNILFVTSPFYTKRFYNSHRKGKPHGGVDLRGKVGFPIYAIQNGTVVLSERMFFEGIFTVIDHGSKMFSLYMHQSKTLVKEGDVIKKGTKIGEIGSTGISTGPHLHLGLKVNNILLNPLSVLEVNLY